MIDAYGREITYLRMSVTEFCNLRCRYCMPEEGVCVKSHTEMLTEDEMITAVKVAASLGITKLRVTGGEPLVKKNIVSICRRVAAIEGIEEVCITTNGILLPKLAKPLREAGVSRVNFSLDTLNPEKYAYITRRGVLADALAGLESAIEAGYTKIKINAVLIGGFNDDEICDLANLTRKYPVDMRFIEMMPMNDSKEFGKAAYVNGDVILERLPELEKIENTDGVARMYHLPGALGNVGIISPVSAHFCNTCNRLRLTADGKLKPCLHSSQEFDIRGLSEDEMRKQMETAIFAKPARHAGLSAENKSQAGRNMNQIGG